MVSIPVEVELYLFGTGIQYVPTMTEYSGEENKARANKTSAIAY
jgi:hypothetical protein